MLEKIRALTNMAEEIEIALCDLPISKLSDQADDHAESLRMSLEQLLAEAEHAALEKMKGLL